MESTLSPTNSVRRHGRNISHPMPRRSTVGPLDAVDDPLAEPPQQQQPGSQITSPAISPRPGFADSVQSPLSSQLPELTPGRVSTIHVDLQFLLDRRLYHQIPSDDIAPGFADSTNQPPLGTRLEDLLQAGHFRRAAETALIALLASNPGDADRIFKLLHTRLACLVVISRPDLAADEAVTLTEFLNRNTPEAKDVLPAIPWELRLLLVRLQSIAADDGRRAVMSLYALSGDVRSHLADARSDGDEASMRVWSERLKDVGLKVADTLVEIGEFETAARHLDTLANVDEDVINSRKALLSIRVGDLASAKTSLGKVAPGLSKDIYTALLQTAAGDFSKAVDEWRALAENHPDNELLAQNLSACLLYTGRITEARSIFESIARDTTVFPVLLFNLSTVYELCTERAVQRKAGLSQRLAQRTPLASAGGWERTNADFKL